MVDPLRSDGGGHEVDTGDDSEPAIGTTGARFGGASRRKRTARRKSAEADQPPTVEPAPEADTAAIPVVRPSPLPHSGARQHGAPTEVPAEQAPESAVPDGSPIGLTGARFGGARKEPTPPPAPTEPAAPEIPDDPAAPPEEPPPPQPDAEEPVAAGPAIVRPYVFTRGRTRSTFELSIETLVSAVPQAKPTGLTGEHHTALGLCQEPRSVAELAARVGVPLGVARVLVGDLAAAGAVAVHRADGPDLDLMRRVLSGLKRL
jgi:hypothetical protein